MNLGRKIKNHRLSNGETQTEYGERYGVGKSVISNWEKSKNRPNVKRLKLIADDLEVSVTDLLEGASNE
ncbi:helix-turn-helix domain-containing protein [Staphylococcus pseudoxylosus]|uniref:helix-turn-helix domain-containing protein n=1 Tax=Staphylococcus pseudoxylosus TaxID=2282419 RepID=UPI000D1F2959|nr:helix-turn-helix transcriptional regulator [Staphylococcus pseudoxylosus]MEB5783608.1 helix-turn-helix domain-containing protein [Staphylococcus pseudoxylosus]PTI82095.1 transcriptional regulator [Staphylococcus xylosus]